MPKVYLNMRSISLIALLLCCSVSFGQKTIHVYVALCDNANQGIVPVPASLGNGQDPQLNLYWGAAYGLKTYFSKSSGDWILIEKMANASEDVLETLLFKHKTKDVFLLAEAYDGAKMESCLKHFLLASNAWYGYKQIHQGRVLNFAGEADLVVFCGHNGLMDFNLEVEFEKHKRKAKEVIILACYSKDYFAPYLRRAQAEPLLWTTHLMAPEAYTLEAAIAAWLEGARSEDVAQAGAKAYHQYQKCGLSAAKRLLVSGF